jgi:ATP-dependent Lon protease
MKRIFTEEEPELVNYKKQRMEKNILFLEKCYMFDLPPDWKDDLSEEELKKLSVAEKNYLTREYNKIKDVFIERNIQLQDILSLKNVNIEVKTDLIEELSIMKSYEDDTFEYILFRDKLRDKLKKQTWKIPPKPVDTVRKINMERTSIIDDMEEKIMNLKLSDYHTNLIYNKFKDLKRIPPIDSEFVKLKNWLEVVLNIPFNRYSPISISPHANMKLYLKCMKQQLDDELYGMKNVKEELLIMINHKLLHPEASNMIIALVGPPGVGKTHIVHALSKFIKLPYEHISMGGINDVSFLNGHSFTYEGSRPGKIVNSLIKMNSMNGILFFDEVDKIGTTRNGEEVTNQLIHITDFTQNHKFCDKYIPDIPIDISKMWFIFSLNHIDQINPVLKNRIKFIKVDGYSTQDKIQIVKKYLIPNNMKEYNIQETDYVFTDEIIEYIVKKTKEEEGVREIKRSIEQIFRRLELIKTMEGDNEINISFNIPLKNSVLTKKDVDILLTSKIEEEQNPSLRMMYM